ncbi:elongation factor G [Rhodocytophaga rosea]|uniref:Elongation factor G n=1 Tax=Rhodocytophaga rosea TaxID=2704465 RepID=A0A6C0GJ37_9BACT|nr:elongation factor G [Rhodocytophaga rosea]QHT68046.1 elongation factor G [Rhodocytophaga rosea]
MTRLSLIRNIGIMAHIDAGKTTLSERILFYAGRIRSTGEVHDGNTVLDSMALERQKGITISAAATCVSWNYPTNKGEVIYNTKPYQINLIDTPGHIDFTVEVARSLRVLDGAVFVLSAVEGVQPQSETVWRQADRYKVPRIAFVNKMDRAGADFFAVLADLKEKLVANALPLQIPIGEEDRFEGVVDLLTGRAIRWLESDKGKSWQEIEVPLHLVSMVQQYGQWLVEEVASYDDELLEKYLSDLQSITLQDLQRAIRKATISGEIVPVLCGSAFKNKGIQPILDAIVAYLPSPVEVVPVEGIDPQSENKQVRRAEATAPFAALAFKIITDSFVGKLTFIRIYSGSLQAGSYVLNMRTGKKERVSRLMQMHADKQEPLLQAQAGDIVAVVGLRDVYTGDTLCEQDHPIVLEQMEFPEPVIGYAIEAKRAVDADKLANALAHLLEEDPTLQLSTDTETGQTLLKGMGELHLEVILSRLAADFGVEVNQGVPQVAYREMITQKVVYTKRYKKQNGGSGSFALITFELSPVESGKKGLIFINAITGGAIPKEYVPAIQKGFENAMQHGPLGGYPIEAMQVTLLDGRVHKEDSDALSFEMAATLGFKEGVQEAKPALLEPVMKVEVTTPDVFIGGVIGDLNRRRGTIKGIEAKGNVQMVNAQVPLSTLFGYVTVLRTITNGRGQASMQLEHYAPVPSAITQQVLTKSV